MDDRSSFRLCIAAMILVVAALFAWLVTRTETFWFDRPERRLKWRTELFLNDVADRDPGLRALWTFDERIPGGWFPDPLLVPTPELTVDHDTVAFPGTERVAGRHGDARRFSGDDESFLFSERSWKHEAEEPFTLAMWLRLKAFPLRQDILYSCESELLGLRMDDGRIVFDFVTDDGPCSISAPFARDGLWRHVAVVANPAPEGGRISIFVDGSLASEASLSSLPSFRIPFAFGCASLTRVRHPLCGDLDDVAVWNRALSADEIHSIAESSLSVAETLSSRHVRQRLSRAGLVSSVRASLGNVFLPWCDKGSSEVPDAPPVKVERVSLRFGTGELRHLLRAHERARRSGALTAGTARAVGGFLTIGGRSVRCRVSLHGAPSFYADTPRPSFAIDPIPPETAFPNGARRFVLSPPEACGGLFPLAGALVAESSGLPVAPGCSLVDLRLNGNERGIYLMRDFSRMGGVAGLEEAPESGSMSRNRKNRAVESERAVIAPNALSKTVASTALAFLSPNARANIAVRLASAESLLAADPFSPAPPLRRRAFLHVAVAAWEPLLAERMTAQEAPLDATLFSGANVSPFRVVFDLPFERIAASVAPGASLRFHSLTPALLDDSGHIVLRPAEAPEEAHVEVTWRDAEGSERKEVLHFRIMPENIRIPTLCLWTGSLLEKLWKTDAAVEWYEPGPATNGPAHVLSATASGRGGLRFRGNTSFRTPRKSLSLRTDVPNGFFGVGTPGRAIVVAGGFSERLVLGNAFSLGLFRDFPPRADGGSNVCSRVRRAELFINGRYCGLRECMERVDRDLPGSSSSTFFRHAVASPRNPYMIPVHAPSRAAEEEATRAFFDAELLAEGPAQGESAASWGARVAARIDLGSAADIFLLSDLVGNMNGFPRPFPFDEILRFDPVSSRFDYVPWDFDRILHDANRSAATDSDRRFLSDLPGYNEQVSSRWRQLRAGPCADDALCARLDALWEESEGYLDCEAGLWGSDVMLTDVYRSYRSVLLSRARRLDALFGPSMEEAK